MRIEFDEAKNQRNIEERSLPFTRAADFDFENAKIIVDDRKEYGEVRYVATGYLDGRLHVLAFKAIEGGIRVISFRKANAREVKLYEQE
jgi:uncharacterized DUF497 family protein